MAEIAADCIALDRLTRIAKMTWIILMVAKLPDQNVRMGLRVLTT
ncbi:MAG: hypothetical protein ABIR55_00525 [Burkholderiaceae bacterium]